MNVKYSELSKNAISGRGSLRYVLRPSGMATRGRLADCVSCVQEMQEKYRKSKEELDELVANMEGL